MGKPTGFIEYLRELPVDRTPRERVRDWNEFHHHMDEKRLRQQGARCMDCGVPFCHTGKLISGMASGCPINNLIPEWNDLVYRGLWQEALDRLHKTNNFPEFTGRVCPAPCEGSCVLGINSPPVTIKNIESRDHRPGLRGRLGRARAAEGRTGKKVAVVGSGPAGLAAAAQLNRAGHQVTVFERADRPGGLLMYGIPNMKLDKRAVVERRLKLMEQEGIKFICNADVGENVEAELLLKDFDAIVLCTGATQPRDLPVDGREPQGHPFRHGLPDGQHQGPAGRQAGRGADPRPRARTSSSSAAATPAPTASARPCARAARRSPSSRSCRSRPWTAPRTIRGRNGRRSTSSTTARKRPPRSSAPIRAAYLTTVKKFIGDAAGNVTAVVTVEISWEKNAAGPVRAGGTGRQREDHARPTWCCSPWASPGPRKALLKDLGVERDARSNVKAEHEQYTTSVKGVFAAGDCRRGQSLIVWAINEGRGVAREVDRYLMGSTQLP